jgi:hypothetical protein
MKRDPYITITKGMRGWFAVMIWWNPEGFEEPYQTGIGSYKWPEQAEPEARDWADAEGIEFVPIKKENKNVVPTAS